MKFLLVPGNNSFSHVAKCLAIEDGLKSLGYGVLVAVSRKSALFVRGLGRECAVLPDLQENDNAGFPNVDWFRHPQRIADCIRAEVGLMMEYRPDRVLGVFHFTAKASAALVGIPFDSLTCGCMLLGTEEVLGFAHGDHGIDEQKKYLELFYQYAGAKVGAVLRDFGLASITDIREMLQGESTFLWDFPEFMPASTSSKTLHVGPIFWHQWPHDEIDISRFSSDADPLAVVSFGTCVHSIEVATRMVRLLDSLGYQVLLAAGGQKKLLNAMGCHPRVTVCSFAPLHLLFHHTSLLVCHGGQMTVFEAISNQVPVLVMPLQPEQSHNGVCLERIGCGLRLQPPQVFSGNSQVYIDSFLSMTDEQIFSTIRKFTGQVKDSGKLADAQKTLRRFHAVQAICSHIGG